MGDFSIPCCISRLPIACMQTVICIPVVKSKHEAHSTETPWIPIDIPYEREMGSYGEPDEGPPHDYNGEIAGDPTVSWLYAHKDLYLEAGRIWREYLNVRVGLASEIADEHGEYKRQMAISDDENWQKGCVRDIMRRDRSEWARRLNHLIISVDPDFGRHLPVWQRLVSYVKTDDISPEQFDNIRKIEDLIAAFMASRIIGHKIEPPSTYCSEQYPSFVPERKWYEALAKAAKEYQTRHNDEDDF